MKISFFTQNNKIIGWATKDTEGKNCGKEILDVNDSDFKKLQNGKYDIEIINNSIKFTEKIDIEKEQKKALKLKFQSGNFTNEDIKKLAEILL